MDYPNFWENKSGVLVREFELKNFTEAVDFVNKVAKLAEAQNHHPDLEIFSYKKVKIKLVTHSENNEITNKDIALAEKINELL